METYGHRGAKGVVMENSLLGFTLAASQGVDRFELDIRLSSDNQLMVVHDEKLLRLANSPLAVSKSKAQLLSQTHLKGIDQGIPTLEEVVSACPNVLHWQFEIKTQSSNPKFIRPMKRLIDKFSLHEKVVITSKHVGMLRVFQRILPNIPRGYVQEWPIPSGIRTAQKLNCKLLALNIKLASKRRIKKAQSLGLCVCVWTVNSRDDLEKLRANGADSIISDYPQMAREHLSNSR
ncbi:MAG: glycerophosphodiester phosphodiesterase [Bermanella sp.]